MDLTVPIAIISAGSVLKAPTEDFLKRIFGPAADEFGSWIQENISAYRARNTGRAMVRAEEMLAAVGREVKEVPFRTLLPLLEGASVEDNFHLGELWAALLANAASETPNYVPPIYPMVLRQLTPFDATLLSRIEQEEKEWMESDVPSEPDAKFPKRWGPKRNELSQALNAAEDVISVGINTLVALGLIEGEPVARMEGKPGTVYLSTGQEFRLSPLGSKFLSACSPPKLL